MSDRKYVKISIRSRRPDGTTEHRSVDKVTSQGMVLGYVARTLSTTLAPLRAGWSYCMTDEPEDPGDWTEVGPGSTREQATEALVDALVLFNEP